MSKKDLLKLVEAIYTPETQVDTIVYYDKPSRNDVHPTMKPVGLVGRLMRNSSKPKSVVYDAFGGSGSTMIAAEQLKRRCLSMELDPKYVDVIVNRYYKYCIDNNKPYEITLYRGEEVYDVSDTSVLVVEDDE